MSHGETHMPPQHLKRGLTSATGNAQLPAQASFSRLALANGREGDVVNRCQSIHTLGQANAAALAARVWLGGARWERSRCDRRASQREAFHRPESTLSA